MAAITGPPGPVTAVTGAYGPVTGVTKTYPLGVTEITGGGGKKFFTGDFPIPDLPKHINMQ